MGYLSDDIVGNDQGIGWCVADNLDKGVAYDVAISKLTGGGGLFGAKKHYGVNLIMTYYPFRAPL